MKRTFDFLIFLFFLFLSFFFFFPKTFNFYKDINAKYPIILSFLKFSILATYGEIISYRIRNKKHIDKSFGVFPKMLICGILGIFIWAAFQIFSNGTIKGLIEPMQNYFNKLNQINKKSLFINILNEISYNKIFISLSISFFMNIFFAPVMMLSHNLTDLHISKNNGKFIINKFNPLYLLKEVDWNKMWGFVFKKTIPFFWIPAHTITFLLPSNFRVLFAAFLSVILGILLSLKKN